MLITNFNVKKVDCQNCLVGIANITIDNAIAIHDIKIINKSDKYFIAMPSKKIKNDSFVDVVHPISSKVRDIFEKLLIVGMQVLLETDLERIDFQIKEDSLETDFYSLSLHDYIII